MTSPPAARRLDLPRHPRAASQARAFIDEHFAQDLSPQALGDLRLVVTELVGNAVIHGKGRVTLRARGVAGGVRVEVIDEGEGQTGRIRAQAPPPDAGGGRGLQIVQASARRWGAHEGSTHVWAEVAAS